MSITLKEHRASMNNIASKIQFCAKTINGTSAADVKRAVMTANSAVASLLSEYGVQVEDTSMYWLPLCAYKKAEDGYTLTAPTAGTIKSGIKNRVFPLLQKTYDLPDFESICVKAQKVKAKKAENVLDVSTPETRAKAALSLTNSMSDEEVMNLVKMFMAKLGMAA